MALTKEQWADIEKHLSGMFGRVKLRCDGYEVAAEIGSIKPLKQGIVVYVNGLWKGEWMDGKAEEARKFHCEKKTYLWPVKSRTEAAAMLKKRSVTGEGREFYKRMANDTVSVWRPYWTCPKAFCRHLKKTCESIEIVEMGYGV